MIKEQNIVQKLYMIFISIELELYSKINSNKNITQICEIWANSITIFDRLGLKKLYSFF